MSISPRVLALEEVGTGAGGAVPLWLPWALVGVGGVLLTAVLVTMLRARASHRAGGGELADLEHRLIEVKKLAATVADDLDRRAQRLERLIARADELLERDGGAEDRPSAQTRSAQRPPATPTTAVDDLALRVFELADRGHSALQIAQALRQPIGNIELMLALRGGR